MTAIILRLVRHGRAAGGLEDLDPRLDDVGRAQATAAATALASVGARLLFVSPLRRTRETAEPIALSTGRTPHVCPEVAEVFDPSLPARDRLTCIGPLLRSRWSDQPPELRAWRARVIATLLTIPEDAIVVSHFVAISAAIGAATADDRVSPAPLPNASITTLHVEGGTLTLFEGPSVAHLAGALVTGGHAALGGTR